MARLTFTNGVTVDVPDEKAEGLSRMGFTAAEEPKKAPAKKSASSKSSKK